MPHGPNFPSPEHFARTEFDEAERAEREKQIAAVERGFLARVRGTLADAPYVEDAVAMYFCLRDPDTPFWVKAGIGLALAYFVSPVDLIPDVVPFVSQIDDGLVIATAMKAVKAHVEPAHHVRARRWLTGEADGSENPPE